MRSDPEDMIEDLREAARLSYFETEGHIPLAEVLQWEAADWIEATCALLERVREAGGDMALTAIELLAGDFPRTDPDDD